MQIILNADLTQYMYICILNRSEIKLKLATECHCGCSNTSYMKLFDMLYIHYK